MSFYNLDENSATVKHPKGLKIKLKPHQLTVIAAMRELEKQGTILIDKPDVASGLYNTVKFKLNDVTEFTGSTFVVETNSAILADKVGAGKTYMIIGLILNTPVPNIHDRFIVGTDHFSIKMMSVKESEGVNLIVVPHNLANQWGDFVDKSNLDYLKLNAITDFDVFFDIDYVTKQVPMPDCPVVIHSKTKKKNIP
jgi:SNF2 family DNA or RNA helicase